MKCFLAYRVTGEQPSELNKMLVGVKESLKEVGVESYCTVLDYKGNISKENKNAKEVMEHAFDEIGKSDFLFVIQTSEDKSEGMIMEVGYCIAKSIPVLVATRNDVRHTYLPDMGKATFKWDDLKNLQDIIKKFDYNKLI